MDVFLDCLRTNNETRRVECKGPASKRDLIAGIAKAALGFANHRDGGWILLGASQDADGLIHADGLKDHYASFDVLNLPSEISSYGSPSLRVEAKLVTDESGSKFIGITILPFEGNIVICRRSSASGEPAVGKVYVRADNVIESRPATADDMAKLVEVAVEFRLKSQIERLVNAGVLVVAPELSQQIASGAERYRNERGSF